MTGEPASSWFTLTTLEHQAFIDVAKERIAAQNRRR